MSRSLEDVALAIQQLGCADVRAPLIRAAHENLLDEERLLAAIHGYQDRKPAEGNENALLIATTDRVLKIDNTGGGGWGGGDGETSIISIPWARTKSVTLQTRGIFIQSIDDSSSFFSHIYFYPKGGNGRGEPTRDEIKAFHVISLRRHLAVLAGRDMPRSIPTQWEYVELQWLAMRWSITTGIESMHTPRPQLESFTTTARRKTLVEILDFAAQQGGEVVLGDLKEGRYILRFPSF